MRFCREPPAVVDGCDCDDYNCYVPVPILATKLYIPQPPPQVVFRPRLLERLDEGLRQSGGFASKLTLIAAPSGFGKTTLVSAWGAMQKVPMAWLSLDEGDGDPTRFLTYLVSALRTLPLSGVRGSNAVEGIEPKFGRGVLEALQAPQPPPTELILTALLNEIAVIPVNFVLVLDDYHLVDSSAVDDALTFLLEHLPSQMHLLITTREDPQLPLPRLRARGLLTELRAADLRFTPSEAAEFLNSVMALSLSAADIAALEDRTEGWIAGLQLAALAVRGQLSTEGPHDVSGFVRAFAGDHRYIVDYLVAEVLQRQPEPVRRFLLQTAILDRLNGPLCDAVTEQKEGSARLQALERGNFFLVPLDDRRHWYRYHHLFAQVLYAHLMAEQRNLVPTLHRRASEWYEKNGLASDAVRHAFAAEDFERAADLIELSVPALSKSRQTAALVGWLRALPDELIRARPVLSVTCAHLLLDSGATDGVEDRLRDAERWLDASADMGERPGSPAGMVVVDDEAFRRLPGAIAVARAGQALARGDLAGTVKYARRVLDLLPENDHLNRGGAAGFLGLAAWTGGDLEAAHRAFAEGMAHLERAGNLSDVIGGAVTLADIRIAQGRLRDAMSTYERGLQLATAQGEPVLRGTADMYVGMSELHRERNDLYAATQCLLTSKELGEHTGFPQNRYRRCVAMARIREAQGDPDGALDLLSEAERLYVSPFTPNVRPIATFKARVWVAQGKLGQALGWAHERGLSVEDDLSYLREFEHITLARVRLAQSGGDHADRFLVEAMGLLDRLLQAAEQGGRKASTIEILALQALAHGMRGDIPAALVPLEHALMLAEPEGYVRIFVDEGRSMAHLLREAAARGIMPDYTAKLRSAFHVGQGKGAGESPLPTSPASRSLVEPLTERELEILRLFKTELSGPEIADKLVIALSTLRTHTKHIFSKLDVTNRRAAVQRAAELNLI